MSSGGMKVGGAQTVCSGVGLGDRRDSRQTPVCFPVCSVFCAKTNSTVRKCPRGGGCAQAPGPPRTQDGLDASRGESPRAPAEGPMLRSHTRPQNTEGQLTALQKPTI